MMREMKPGRNGPPLMRSDDQLSACLTKVSRIENVIRNMRERTKEMDKLQKNLLTRPFLDKREAKELEKVSDGIFSTSTQIQKEINVFREEVHSYHMDPHHETIIENHIKRLTADTTKASHEFRAAQVDYIEKTQKLHKRRAEIALGDDTTSNNLTHDPSNIQAVLTGDYMIEAAKIRHELRDTEVRDAKIKELTSSVIEVNALFKEINALIMEQGETIDTIEKHIEQAEVYVEKGKDELKKGLEQQKKARRRKWGCIGVLVVVVIIVAVIVIIAVA